jgi:pyruvate/2-oxoglutarate/acetoin dehydrogenase E1 component
MLGVRPVIELMFWSFYSVAFDQILNNAANVRYMSGGQINCPIVIRGRRTAAPTSAPPTPTPRRTSSPTTRA